MQDQVALNRRRAAVMLAGFGATVFVVAAVVLAVVGAGLAGAVVALVLAAGAVAVAYVRSDSVVVRLARAGDADPVAHARLHNLVEGLCLAHGLPKPRLCIVDSSTPNALAAGRSREHGVVVVTAGLLATLDRLEMEAVLAHELSHIRNEDIVPATVAVGLFGVIAPGAVARVVDEDRERDADASAVSMTRYPPALISALEKLRSAGTQVSEASPALAPLWIEPPAPAEVLEQRIAVLREL